MLPQRTFYYRADIASRIGCAPPELMLVPGKPVPIDVTMHGFSCRNALAAMSIGHLPALHTLFVGLVDARRLMLDWQIVATPDGWLHVPTLLAACGSHLPAAWEAYIVGDVDAQEWLPYSSGDIFQVESRPTDAANHAASAYDSQVQEDAGAASTQPIADSSFTARHPETAGAGASNGLPPAGQGGVQRALPEPTDHAPARPADVPVPSSDDAAVRSAATSDYVATALLHARGDKCRSPALQDFHRSGIGFYTSGSLSKTKPLLLRSEGQRAATAVCIGICGLLCCMAAGPGHEGQELQSFAGCLALSTIYQAHRKLLPACLFVFMLMSCTTVTATSTWHPALYNAKIHAGESMCELSPVSSSSIVVPPPATRIRLIPTPCNGRSPRSADLYHPSPLRTLLEESLQASDNRAMFLAATLLDTLVEHFAASPVATASEADELFGATTTRPVLHLDELVPLGHEDPSPNTFASSVASQPALPPLLDLKPISASAASISTSSQPVLIGATPLGFAWNDLGSLFDFHPETKPWSAFFPVQHPKSRQVQAAMQILREDHPAGQVYCYTDGSFYPGTATRPAALGWACMFVDATHGRCAWVAGPVPAWLLSEERPSAFLAECAALIFGKVIAATVQRTFGLIFRSDCQAAIGIAAGTAAHRDSAIPSALANASAFCRYTHPHRDTTEYVPGHSGHFFNEVVDEIAKWGAQQQPSVYPPLQVGGTLHSWLTGGARALSWAGLAFQSLCGNWSAPPLHGDLGTDQDHAGLSPFQLVEPFIPSGTITRPHDLGTDTHLQFQATVVSYNTLSLGASLEDAQGKGHEGPGLQYRPGRAAILAEQLHNIGATIVALQETRCPEGRTTIGKYIRLSAGAVKGQLGTELWIHTEIPFFLDLGTSKDTVCFTAQSFVVVHADPRRMLARHQHGTFRLLIASLHAPHRGWEKHCICAWWHETLQLLHKYGQLAHTIVAGDLNASVGSRTSPNIGGVAAEEEDEPGEFWHRALKAMACFLPCSFDDFQQGPTATYHQKRNGHACRPDMIGIPCAWRTGQIAAWTAPEIHVALASQDHFATCVRVSIRLRLPCKARPSASKRISASLVTDPAQQEAIHSILRSAPAVPWSTSAHAHAALLVKHLQDGLGKLATAAPPKPRHPYIQDSTWELQRRVTHIKRALHRVSNHLRTQLQAVCFLAWRGDATMADNSSEDNPLRCAWMRRATFSALALRYQLAKTCRALRGACRADRDFYVSELARQVASNPSSEVFAALHRLLCHKRKKPFAPEPLPRLIDANGETCPDAEAANNRWREYFGAMEGGTAMDFHSLPVAILASPPPSASWPAPACAGQLPSVADLQKVMVCTKAGKAPGPDGIPGMLLKHFAPDMSILTYPLLLKLALRGCESVGFKGGLAVKFWKGKGSKQEASSYRQILLMSNLAKSVHQALRPALRDLFTERAPALQLGGKPGCSVVYGAHITRSFLRWQSTLHNSCFILFTDIASAFYSVVRQLVAKAPTQLAQPLLEGADLTLDDLEALRCHLEDDSALTQIGASSWLEALSQQLTQDTWFLLQHDHFPVLTSKGTRPGSSWADLLFAFVVKKITDRRDALLAEASPRATAPLVPADCAKTLHPCDLEQGLRPLTDLTWADDIATMRVVTSASQLLVGVKTTIGASCDAFSEHGFRLSYGPRKTAALAQPAGTGARDARRVMFGAKGCQGQVSVLRESHQPVKVPLVQTYRHLGAQISMCGRMKQEIAHRVSQAKAAFQECRKKIFKAPGVPLSRKAYVFQSLVAPKLLYGAGAWPPLKEQESRTLKGALWQMYRQLLCIPRYADQHYTGHTVLALLQLPGPDTLLHCSRLQYLGQLLRTGPEELWTLLRLDGPYCEALAVSCRWLHKWVSSTCPLPDPDTCWPQWVDIASQWPNRLKGWIKRAQALTVRQVQVIAALDGLYRGLQSVLPSREEPPPAVVHPEVCIPCGKLFSTRVAWSCHAQKVHGYRTTAYLLGSKAPRPLCAGCGKLYASRGRLQRHLAYSPDCIRHWGCFQATTTTHTEAHPQAPPDFVPGYLQPGEGIDYDAAISAPLLHELSNLDTCEEDCVWEVVSSHIAPIEVLRCTVRQWAQDSQLPDAAATAHNMLLLLDPDLLGETQAKPSPRVTFDDAADKVWAPMPPTVIRLVGKGPPCKLVEPPAVILPPSGHCSLTLRQATAYATWLEQACAAVASCLSPTAAAPVSVSCKRLEFGLGIASSWLRAAGATFHADGLDFARG